MLPIDLNNKVALVTGVSNGLGSGIAKILAKAGCNVAGCGQSDIESEGAKKFLEDVKAEGKQAFYLSCDITNEKHIEEFVAKTVEKFKKIDILISNAGRNVFKGAEECSLNDWEYNINLNFKSHWYISKLCKPYLEKSDNGFILIMTSNHAYSTIPGCFPYNSAKSALTGLVNAISIEWAPTIRVVGLAPGFIETKGGDTWFNSFDNPEKEKQRTIELHPVKRLGSVEEVGAFCTFLASDYARFITGTTYLMDGGRSALMQDNI